MLPAQAPTAAISVPVGSASWGIKKTAMLALRKIVLNMKPILIRRQLVLIQEDIKEGRK